MSSTPQSRRRRRRSRRPRAIKLGSLHLASLSTGLELLFTWAVMALVGFAAYAPGDRVLVQYPRLAFRQERLILAEVQGTEWYIVTSDGDIYVENLNSPPMTSMMRLDATTRTLSPFVPRAELYMMENGQLGRDYTRAEFLLLQQEATRLATADLQALGLLPLGALAWAAPGLAAPLGGAMVAAAAAGAAPAGLPAPGAAVPPLPAGYAYVLVESLPGMPLGTLLDPVAIVSAAAPRFLVSLPSGETVFARLMKAMDVPTYVDNLRQALGGGAAAPAAADGAHMDEGLGVVLPPIMQRPPEDLRVIAVKYDWRGERHRSFAEAIDMMSEGAWADFPVKGPRSALWVGRFCKEHGGSPSVMHQAWKTNCKLTDQDNGVALHEMCCRLYEQACCYDQLNVGELAVAETSARAIQMTQWRWKGRLSNAATADEPTYLFFGGDSVRGGLCVSPALNTWLGEQMHRETMAAKEVRKA